MSRAKTETERNALDFYATPDALASAICEHLRSFSPAYVVEPSAGHGPFVRAAKAAWPDAFVCAIDVCGDRLAALRAAGADVAVEFNWLDWARSPRLVQHDGPVLIIGNPPFREAEAHIRAALRWMAPDDELAFLLRLNFLGSQERVRLFEEWPVWEVTPIIPRPSFTGGGSDATEYALFRWIKGQGGPSTLAPPIIWKKRPAASASVEVPVPSPSPSAALSAGRGSDGRSA